jgi:RNA polymerase sigma-70 factor (sigma-E family)
VGEQQADFEAFVASRGAALLRFAFMLTHDRGRAEDLVQEALVKVHRRWGRVVAAEQPEAYVRGIVTHEFLSWRRRCSSGETPGVIPSKPVQDPSAAVDERDAVWRALAVLPPRQRAVLVLRFYEDMPDAQIASVLECAVGTVASLASRGLATLRAQSWADRPDTLRTEP